MLYEKRFAEHFSKVQIFTFKDASRFLKRLGASEAYVKLFMHNRLKKGMRRIGKGAYTFQDTDAVIGFAYSPFYYGMEYALTIHRLWTQMADPVIITTRSVVPGEREAGGTQITIRKISGRMFFGTERLLYDGMFVPVSDVEKTLIDFIYYRVNIGAEDMSSLVAACNKGKLRKYSRLCSKTVSTRLNRILSQHKTSKNSAKQSANAK